MDRREYLEALDRALRGKASRREREDILRYYTEYFDEAGAEGEARVIARLGDPEDLARMNAGQTAPYPLPPDARAPDPDDPAGRGRRKGWLLAGGVGAAAVLLCLALWLPRREVPQPVESYDKPTTVTGIAFQMVQVETMYADVSLKTGADYQVDVYWNAAYEYEMGCEVRDGVLYVSAGAPPTAVAPEEFACAVEITVPAGVRLEDVTLTTAVGDVAVHDAAMETLTVSTGRGDVEVFRAVVREAPSLFTGNGKVLRGQAGGEPAA